MSKAQELLDAAYRDGILRAFKEESYKRAIRQMRARLDNPPFDGDMTAELDELLKRLSVHEFKKSAKNRNLRGESNATSKS